MIYGILENDNELIFVSISYQECIDYIKYTTTFEEDTKLEIFKFDLVYKSECMYKIIV